MFYFALVSVLLSFGYKYYEVNYINDSDIGTENKATIEKKDTLITKVGELIEKEKKNICPTYKIIEKNHVSKLGIQKRGKRREILDRTVAKNKPVKMKKLNIFRYLDKEVAIMIFNNRTFRKEAVWLSGEDLFKLIGEKYRSGEYDIDTARKKFYKYMSEYYKGNLYINFEKLSKKQQKFLLDFDNFKKCRTLKSRLKNV